MANHHLQVLGELHVVDSEVDRVLRQANCFAAVETNNTPGLKSQGIRFFKGANDIGRISAARERDQDVPWRSKNLKLGGEDVFVAGIIGQAGCDCGICTERMSPNPAKPSMACPVKEVICPMIRIGSTAAVSTEKYRGFA